MVVTLPVHGQPGARRPTPGQVETLLVLPAVLWWAFPLTHATGGRAPFGLAVELLLLLVAAAATRPWRRLPHTVPLLGGVLGVCAVAVCALSPTGWAGADDAAAYAAAGLALPVAAAWARTSARRVTLAAAVVLAGLDQLSHALLPWWGGRDPSVRLVGTFYWHNPFAAYLLPAALLGLGLLVWRVRPVQAAGWVAAPACAAGVVLSTSRATLALLLLGWVVVGGAAVLAREGRLRRGLRWLVVTGVAVAVTYGLPGPPLFTHRVSPFAATAARSTSGETLTSNGGYRFQFWREALASWAHHPLAGSGYHGLIASSRPYVPIGWARSNYAHNGYLQALTDGGVLLALPFLLGCAWLGCSPSADAGTPSGEGRSSRRCWSLPSRCSPGWHIRPWTSTGVTPRCCWRRRCSGAWSSRGAVVVASSCRRHGHLCGSAARCRCCWCSPRCLVLPEPPRCRGHAAGRRQPNFSLPGPGLQH